MAVRGADCETVAHKLSEACALCLSSGRRKPASMLSQSRAYFIPRWYIGHRSLRAVLGYGVPRTLDLVS